MSDDMEMKMVLQDAPELRRGSIVQITLPSHHWFPCLIIVDEVRKWGIVGYLHAPGDRHEVGQAFIRLKSEEYSHVGESLILLETHR